jgi:hypothetical protein
VWAVCLCERVVGVSMLAVLLLLLLVLLLLLLFVFQQTCVLARLIPMAWFLEVYAVGSSPPLLVTAPCVQASCRHDTERVQNARARREVSCPRCPYCNHC